MKSLTKQGGKPKKSRRSKLDWERGFGEGAETRGEREKCTMVRRETPEQEPLVGGDGKGSPRS